MLADWSCPYLACGDRGLEKKRAFTDGLRGVVYKQLNQEDADAQQEKRKRKRQDPLQAASDERMANALFLTGFDDVLRLSGIPCLSAFIPSRRILPLSKEETREIIDTQPFDDDEEYTERRVVVRHSTRPLSFEAPIAYDEDGNRAMPVMHICADLGPVGHPGVNWLIRGLGWRGTYAYDVLHRRVDDISEAEGRLSSCTA